MLWPGAKRDKTIIGRTKMNTPPFLKRKRKPNKSTTTSTIITWMMKRPMIFLSKKKKKKQKTKKTSRLNLIKMLRKSKRYLKSMWANSYSGFWSYSKTWSSMRTINCWKFMISFWNRIWLWLFQSKNLRSLTFSIIQSSLWLLI